MVNREGPTLDRTAVPAVTGCKANRLRDLMRECLRMSAGTVRPKKRREQVAAHLIDCAVNEVMTGHKSIGKK